MSIRILSGIRREESDERGATVEGAAFYESTSEQSFGPVLELDDLLEFQAWCVEHYRRVRPEVVMDDYAAWTHDRKVVGCG